MNTWKTIKKSNNFKHLTQSCLIIEAFSTVRPHRIHVYSPTFGFIFYGFHVAKYANLMDPRFGSVESVVWHHLSYKNGSEANGTHHDEGSQLWPQQKWTITR